MSWLWTDEPPDEPLPHYAVGVCDECWRPAEELVDGLGECCRCHSCGEAAAPIELDERRLCMACRVDAETLRRAAADRGVRHGGVAAAEELAAEELAS